MAAVDVCSFPPLEDFAFEVGFQLRKAVQGLQGFPSGPVITPGDLDFCFSAWGSAIALVKLTVE